MTLGQMRDALRRNIFDLDGTFLDDNTNQFATAFINEAMHHVANWADRQDQGLFHKLSSTVTITTGSADEIRVGLYNDGATYNFAIGDTAKFRRLLEVEQINSASAPVPLQVIALEERMNYWGAQTDTPRVYLSAESLYVIAPNNGTKIRMRYVYALPDMDPNTVYDVPGTQGGLPLLVQDNALPLEYHPLIVTYATVLALAAEASQDTPIWQAIYAEQRDELAATLHRRRGARIGGAG